MPQLGSLVQLDGANVKPLLTSQGAVNDLTVYVAFGFTVDEAAGAATDLVASNARLSWVETMGGLYASNGTDIGRVSGETWTAELHDAFPGRDWILSRILWLSGCEPGRNRLGQVDTFRRYIYLHGTPDNQPMGVPLSHGCVRLRNADLLSLFPRVPSHCAVMIDEAPCPQWAAADLV